MHVLKHPPIVLVLLNIEATGTIPIMPVKMTLENGLSLITCNKVVSTFIRLEGHGAKCLRLNIIKINPMTT